MKFRPCIDLHKGQVKQIVGSSLSDTDQTALKTNFTSELPPAYPLGCTTTPLYSNHKSLTYRF